MGSLPDRVPLVIGVTGHRDLRTQDVPLLEREVAAIITRLQRDYIGEDVETPLILISALAEGADRVVARVALALDVRLIAPLPLPVAEYRRDFPGSQALNNVSGLRFNYRLRSPRATSSIRCSFLSRQFVGESLPSRFVPERVRLLSGAARGTLQANSCP